MSVAKFFLDTNIFVYSYDSRYLTKQNIALDLINKALETRRGVISFQVVQEFLSVMTLKFNRKLSIEDIQAYLDMVLLPLCSTSPLEELYRRSLHIHKTAKISFYDALIIETAAQERCSILYSEDLQHGQTIAGVKIQNPFL